MYDNNNNEFHQNWNAWDEETQRNQPPQKNEKKTSMKTGTIIAIALVCALLGGIVGAGGIMLTARIYKQETPAAENDTTVLVGQRDNTVINTAQIQTGNLMSAAEVYAANVNSTVGITTSVTTNYWGYQTTSAASGSGFILTEDGYILTNHHVIESSDSITVALYDGTTYDATLVGYDASNDIAVLKVEATDLVPVILGDSENVNVGDSVVAIGNPLGELTFSLTAGTISAMEREITMSTGVTMELFQTDCAINSGNSGGALFNMYGEVIGITNAKYSGSSGGGATIDNIGFAIPINDVWNIIESIIENGYISKPYIGVSVTDVSEETQSYGLPEGAAVREVTEDSPAQQAGLQVNDIITSVNGTAITGSSELVKYIGDTKAGDELKLSVYRQGQTIEVNVVVGEKIQQAIEQTEEQPSQGQTQQGTFPFPFNFGG